MRATAAMRVMTRTGSRTARCRIALALAAALAALTAVTGPAQADPLGDAKAQASRLQAQIVALQLRVEIASEKYDGVEAQLGQLAAEQVQATQAAAAARKAADNDRTVVDSRARALYMSGGTAGLYASVLTGGDPTQLLAGLHSVQALSDADHHALSAVTASVQSAEQADAALAALQTKQNDLTAAAAAASIDAQNALAEQQQALADTNAKVVQLEAELQAQIDAANAARDAQTLAAAAQASIASGVVVGEASPLAKTVIAAASTQVGKPYVYGGSGPDSWDCSGLVQWAFTRAGVVLPRTAADQYAAVGQKIGLGQLEPGDLLFWATDSSNPASIHHVAIYLGGGLMLAAPHTGTVVQVQPVYLDGYYGAVRIG
jgi:cell wall-associated NlpC family hydrolase